MERMICPKCQGTMRQYERSGVTVDQCEECRGIFLDRGELERLTEAESAAYNARQTAPPGQQPMGYPDQGASRPGGLLGQLFGGDRHGRDEHGGGYRRGGHH